MDDPARHLEVLLARSRERWWLGALLGGLTCLHVFLIACTSFVVDGVRFFTLSDDAMISMRYAWHLVHGHGLVWNPGERVQGFTNLAWTLVMAAVHLLRLPLEWNGLVIQALNVGIHGALMVVVFVTTSHLASRASAYLAALLVGLSTPLLFWSVLGFETTVFALLVTVAVLPLLEDQSPTSVALAPLYCALACWVRTDGIVIASLLFVAHRACARATQAPWASWFATAALVALLFCGQRLYYGDWLPNTVYLKASSDTRDVGRGLLDLGSFSLWNPALTVGLLLALPSMAGRTLRRWLPMAGVVVGWFAYVVTVGGDLYLNARFFAPVVPLLCIAVAVALSGTLAHCSHGTLRARLLQLGAAPLGEVVLVGLLLVQLLVVPLRLLQDLAGMRRWCRADAAVATRLRRAGLPPGTRIGVWCAGVTPYFLPEHRFHDFLGLTDRTIARSPAKFGPPGYNKWDFDYSLGRVAPDLLVAAEYTNDDPRELARALRSRQGFGAHPALGLHPAFRQYYWPHRTPISVEGERVSDHMHWIYLRHGSAVISKIM